MFLSGAELYRISLFWGRWAEDRRICLLRIIETALGYGDFLKTSFWEPVFGLLVLGKPVKWGFLLPKKEQPILPFLGALFFGENDCCFWEKPHICL